jgi:hypothetical protein
MNTRDTALELVASLTADLDVAAEIIHALDVAGSLATDEEWGVHQGDADLPAGSIDLYPSRRHTMAARNLHGGAPVTRRVTPWRSA